MYNSHSIVFIHWLIAFYGYGVIAQPPGKEHSPVVGKGTDTQWVSNAISGIYITDVIFHFNNDIHRYEIKTEKCSEHIELYFDVPLWKETFQPDINSNDIPKSVNNVTSRIKGKGNEKTNSVMDQINEVLITSPKNRANSGTINYVNPADLIRFNSDKPSNSQPFSTVNVIINGENLDPEDGGYILVPVHCGNKHELMIDIEYTQELIISKARYNIVLDVPIFGNNNILKVLSISKSGIIYTYQPSLSRFHNLYVVSGYHSPGDIINIYVECKYGMPIYNGKELNQLSIILDESILLSHIEIVCDDVVQNDIKVVDKHLYTLKFQKELQEEIKPPTNVMVVHDSLNCKKYKEGGDCVISCPFVKKRFGPLIIDTDPTYRYFIHRLNIIEGYVSELHGHNAGYMKVCSGIVTPIFDLQRNILIYGIHGEKSKTFILSANRNDIPAVTFYQTILDIFIFSTYIMGIVVTTLPYLLRTYKGVIFDKMPMTVDSLVYLAQLLCVYNKYSHRKINEHHMLPNIGMDDKFPTFRTMLLYIYAITASIISSSMQSLKKPNIYKSITDKFKFNRSPHGLSDALFYLFIFSWIFDSLSTISAMLFGGYDPIISIIYITPRGRLAIKLSKWLSHLHYIYSVLGITVAIVALQYAFRRIMLSLKIKWAALQNKKYKWILNIGNFENAISDYSYYEDDDDDRLYTEISGKHSKLTEGYWMDVTCDFLTTQYSDTFTSRKFNLFNRKYAVIAAQVNEVDLSKVEESLYEDKWDSQSQLNTSLNETTQPLGENIPERVRIMRRKNSAASKLTAKGIETTFSNPPTPEIRKKNMRWSYGISQDYTVDIQIDYILQIDSSFYHKTIGTVDSRYIRYFITWNFLKRTSRFITAITMNKVLKLRSMLQVTVKQLLNSDSIEDCDSTKNVKIYLFRESVNTFKAISSILTVVTFTFSSKSAFYLGILHIVIHMILSLTFLAKPFCNSVDNHISLICMTTGTVILMFPELTVVHSNWNKIICIILILLSIYGMITSIFLIIDTAFIWCLPQCNDNDECNTIVVVKDANDNIVGIIHGSCKIEISTSILTLDEEYGITLNTRVKEGQLPTIVVSLEHIDTSSLYIPFITIANMSNLGDSICVNECQANQSYLRRHISTKFEDRIAHLLVR